MSVKQKISTLSAQINKLKAKPRPQAANSLSKSPRCSLATRLTKAEDSLGGREPGSNRLWRTKSPICEAFIGNLEKAAKKGKGGRLVGLAAATNQLKKSNRQTLLELSNEFVKLREQQNSFREDLANIRSAQADFQTSTSKISDDLAKLRNVQRQNRRRRAPPSGCLRAD